MNSTLVLSFFATLIYTYGAYPYLRDAYKGKVIPHPFTWCILFILVFINLIALISTETMYSSSVLPVFVRLIFIFIGAIIGLLYIKKIAINWFDYVSFGLSLTSVYILLKYDISHAVFSTVIVSIFVIAPTVKKIWYNPNSEDAILWFCAFLSQVLLVLSIKDIILENSMFWFYSITENFLVFLFIVLKRKIKKGKKNNL